ncbi:MAG TPA: hypothetical protein VLT47_11730 [Anaeromyxobacteraceae bacterium]|nr:hypothetical protein [Anaeromyxobacteraceae bacterium]
MRGPRHLLRLAVLIALALPLRAAPQGLAPRPSSVGEAVANAERQAQRRDGLEQEFVLPERPGQNQVAWYDFRWRTLDVPAPGGGKGGLRLYYYASEIESARRALPAIQSAYVRLVEDFHYAPSKRIPYILYATQRELQTTNVFQVTESVLGVTSPEDLKMTVPYFGDHARFLEVSTHEMVHQFTIQKLEEIGPEDPSTPTIFLLPLWFIEGIAEYYTKGGIDPETDLFLRDLVWNPDPAKGYEVVSFADDRHRGYVPTYKLGQARVAFVAETYGREKIQAFLESAYLVSDGAGSPTGAERAFEALVKRVLEQPVEQVDARWRAWLKRRYYAAWLASRQEPSLLGEVRGLPAEPEDFVASADGSVVLARTLDRKKGRATLHLFDPRAPKAALLVASDGVPGCESLHPIEQRTLALSAELAAFSAQDGAGDRLWVRPWRRVETPPGKPPALRLGPLREVPAQPPGGGRFIQITDPAFSPDGRRLAFVGVAGDGKRDVYEVAVGGGAARRLTDDFGSERDLAWASEGIYLSSDATEHGRANLFLLDPERGGAKRLTTGPWNDRQPRPLPDGRVLFSSEAAGKPDLWSLSGGRASRLTDFVTGLRAPAPAPKGGLFASTFSGGVFRIVELPKASLLAEPPVEIPPPAGEPLPIPTADIPADSPRYDAWTPKSWRPDGLMIFGGGTGDAVAGRATVLFSDLLRDHTLYADFAVYGDWNYTQAIAFLADRSRRSSWVLGGFHFVQPQVDRRDPELSYYQRDYGAFGTWRWPIDRFRRVETELMLGAVERYCLTDYSGASVTTCNGVQAPGPVYPDSASWRQVNGGTAMMVAPTVRGGYDTLRYDPLTGPLRGTSLLGELGAQWLPSRQTANGFFRFDAQHFWQLAGRANLMLRLAGGTSFSPTSRASTWEKSWWLSAPDNLRGFYPFDTAYLVGPHYWVANAELQLPLDPVLKLLIFDYVEGVAALDFGGVFQRYGSGRDVNGNFVPGAWEARTLTGVLGVNVLFGPLLLRVHFGHPWDVGGVETPALHFGERWVTNVTLRWFLF